MAHHEYTVGSHIPIFESKLPDQVYGFKIEEIARLRKACVANNVNISDVIEAIQVSREDEDGKGWVDQYEEGIRKAEEPLVLSKEHSDRF